MREKWRAAYPVKAYYTGWHQGGPRAALIADGLWRRQFAADPGIVGKEIQINAQPFTVIGVMPRTFNFPAGSNDPAQVWVSFQFDPASPGGRGNHYLYVIGRLKSAVNVAQARSEMEALMAGWKREQSRSAVERTIGRCETSRAARKPTSRRLSVKWRRCAS